MTYTSLFARCLFLVGCALGGGAASAYDAVWVGSVEPLAIETLRLTVTAPEEVASGEVLRVEGTLETRTEYSGVRADLTVLDQAGAVIASNLLVADLYRGPNALYFDLDTASLPEGEYDAIVTINYSDRRPPVSVSLPMRRVSSTTLKAAVATSGNRIESMATLSGDAPVDARLNICREVLEQARADAAASNWRALANKTDYLDSALGRIAAGMVFADTAGPETVVLPQPTQAVSLGSDGFYARGVPAFPLGVSLDTLDLAGLERARRLGAQWVNVSVGPAATLMGDGSSGADVSGVLGFVARANELGLAVTLRLRPDLLSEAMLSRYPEIRVKGFVDIAHPDARLLFEKHLAALLPALQAGSVAAIELMLNPRFEFEEERFRQLFISHIERNYPDRIDLNRAWHSHLAAYSEITLKGEFEHSYQNRRAFQYDWQTFHRDLAMQYVNWAAELAQKHGPGIPQFTTFSEQVFEKGVARHEAKREESALSQSASSVSASVGMGDDIYAITYPRQSAIVALTRSIAPEKPLLIPDFQLGIAGDPNATSSVHDMVRTALWDLYIKGANAVSLDLASPWLSNPNALEALLTTRAELERVAPIVQAFHRAPIDIAILFSNSSRLLDGGDPHLQSAYFAYEGATFSGYKAGFITEGQCVAGALAKVPVLIIPDTPAVSDEAFAAIGEHVQQGAAVARTGRPIPYNEYGMSRHDVVRNTGNTVLVRGLNLPTEYLHAMDALIDRGALDRVPRPVNGFGFPLEGVTSRFVEVDGQPYLYLVSLRKDAVECYLTGSMHQGKDVLLQQNVTFPRQIEPLKPMLIALDSEQNAVTVTAVTEPVAP